MILLLTAATAGIGLLPGYAAIGVLAPVLLVGFRTLQGLSVGGEAAGATAFVVEDAPEGRRGWYRAWLWSTPALGAALGIGAAVASRETTFEQPSAADEPRAELAPQAH